MIYAPHILQVENDMKDVYDEFGRIIANYQPKWIELCRCRCDDNTTKEFKSVNGEVYRPNYHVVCEGNISIKAGDKVRCLDSEGNIRGEGEVYIVKHTNYFKYTEIWM